MNILAIGAHPDDIELGCGGTLIKAAKSGHNVFLCVLTRGGRSGDPEQRAREVVESARFIGAKAAWVDNFEDTKLLVESKLINHIEYFINKADPDIILTHAVDDYHHDHRAVAECTLEAARNSQNVLAYEIPVTKKFSPQLYYDITEVMDEKLRLIEIFWSQRGKIFTKINAIKGMAEFRALQSRLNTTISHVESFEVLKMCVDIDFRPMKLQSKGIVKAVIDDVSQDLDNVIEYRKTDEVVQTQQIEPTIENSLNNLAKEMGKNVLREAFVQANSITLSQSGEEQQ